MSSPFLVGISGGSGAGKTYLVRSIMQNFRASEICFISQDNYYKKKELVPKDDKGIENFDTLEAINFNEFYKDIKRLREGKSVEIQEYTFNHPNKKPSRVTLQPSPILLIEGIFLFAVKEVFDLLDLKIFIEANDIIKIKRRILRDAQERGYDFNDVFYRYENHVDPAFEKYIRPYIEKADLIIPNYEKFDKAVEVLTGFLKTKISVRGS